MKPQQYALLEDIYEYLKRCADEEWDGERHQLNEEARLVVRMGDVFGMEG